MTIHKEGRRIVAIAIVVLALLAFIVYWFAGHIWWLSCGSYVVLLFFAYFFLTFFRKPNRALYLEEGAVIAPADGKVIIIQEVFEQECFKEPRIQVSIFMSIFNVHINWYPIGGIIDYFKHHNGHFHAAYHPKASEKNEHTTVVVNQKGTKVLFRQIAGYIARRIVCYAVVGKEVLQCTQVGFIKFGSRVDLLLPLDSKIEVAVGQKVRGGQTVVARL
ncbi:MAG: phosphatidylserine decarboxylase family protein [Prevotellaceae bacterium]|jgi:phosphatidylserine decarboxylase|nr:phosphatidylserine decarboxylase family protein [Prevotellaceae bacterium]